MGHVAWASFGRTGLFASVAKRSGARARLRLRLDPRGSFLDEGGEAPGLSASLKPLCLPPGPGPL